MHKGTLTLPAPYLPGDKNRVTFTADGHNKESVFVQIRDAYVDLCHRCHRQANWQSVRGGVHHVEVED